MSMIDIRNLRFKYCKKGRTILDGLRLTCEKGSVNVLLGLNGSGKTTLIKIMAGLLESYEGDVLWDGRKLRDIGIRERSKITSYVAQRSGAIDDFSVWSYLLSGGINKLSWFENPSDKNRETVDKYAGEMGITYLLDRKLGEISGGERQLVSICCALIQDTELIILDEPTSALDIKNQNKVLSVLNKVSEKNGKTIILSSHNPNHALYLDANVILLKDGKIYGQGKSNEIINPETLREIYGDEVCYSNELAYSEISFKRTN